MHIDTAIAAASQADLKRCVAIARQAQAHLRALGLAQWVPAAHEPYRPELAGQVVRGELFRVARAADACAFFRATSVAPAAWRQHEGAALYVSGIVVDRAAAGLGLGARILRWCAAEAARRQLARLRLDCHSGSHWLRGYYAEHGFVEVGRLEQHPGYIGVLMERTLPGPRAGAAAG